MPGLMLGYVIYTVRERLDNFIEAHAKQMIFIYQMTVFDQISAGNYCHILILLTPIRQNIL